MNHKTFNLKWTESLWNFEIFFSFWVRSRSVHTVESDRNTAKAIFFLRQTGERDENSASLDLSKIQIFWSRSDVPNEIFSHTAPLGYLPVTNPDFDKAIKVKPNLPPEIKLHQPFNLELSITNGKAQNQSLCEYSKSAVRQFIFSGWPDKSIIIF